MSVPMRWEDDARFQTPNLPLRPRRSARRASAVRPVVLFFLSVFVCVAAVEAARSALAQWSGPKPLRLTASRSATGQVALDSSSVERRLGYVTVTGDAKIGRASC